MNVLTSLCEAWVVVNCCISVIWKLNTALRKFKWWFHPQNDSRKKNICTFHPLRRGLEGRSSLKTLPYSLDSKSCAAETASSHMLLIHQLLLSGAYAANIVFPRNRNVHWLYFLNTRLPLLHTPEKSQVTAVQSSEAIQQIVKAGICLEFANQSQSLPPAAPYSSDTPSVVMEVIL